MSSSTNLPARVALTDLSEGSLAALLRSLHLILLQPSLLYLAMLTAMLFRPPDLQFYNIDRIAFVALVFCVMLRALLLRHSLRITSPLTWPMLALLVLSLHDVLSQPFEAEAWSVLAAKWAVPFVLFHLAGFVFEDAVSLRNLEVFFLLVLAYLIGIALLFLFDAKSFILPAFIVDNAIGIHADRARGPFLQAVANGVTLNLLGLIAMNSFCRRRLQAPLGLLFFVTLPLAVLATKTRAVWLSFAVSGLILLCWSLDARVRRACICLAMAGGLGLAAVFLVKGFDSSFTDRLAERSPVEFRMAMYEAGWEMVLEKPITGWGFDGMQTELTKRIREFRQKEFFFHNTYLEITVQYGVIGLVFYLWAIVELFRLGRTRRAGAVSPNGSFLDAEFRSLWPVLLIVYLLNASFVVMNYQFVNGLLFTLAGILAAQNRRVSKTHAFAI